MGFCVCPLLYVSSVYGVYSWEYPGAQGIGCNTISSSDTSNFLAFLQELRKDPVGAKLILTAATPLLPWHGPDGNPLSDVSDFAKVLNWIEIMNYDVWGSWSATVGPNAPLDDSCAPSADQQGSAVSAVRAWTGAGMPASQIVLGVAAYGHSFFVTDEDALECNGNVTELVPYPPFDNSKQPAGDKWDDPAGTDECGNFSPVGGLFDFWGLIDAGFLTSNGTAATGIDYRFDDCSKTVSSKHSSFSLSFNSHLISRLTSITRHRASWFRSMMRRLSQPRVNSSSPATFVASQYGRPAETLMTFSSTQSAQERAFRRESANPLHFV